MSILLSPSPASSDSSHTHTHTHNLKGDLHKYRTIGLLIQNNGICNHPSFFVLVTLIHLLFNQANVLFDLYDLPWKVIQSLDLLVTGLTCKEVGGFGCSPHGELSDVPLCFVFSHHVGQVHSAHHFGMLPFPGLSFQEPHRDGQGFCTWLTSVQFSSVQSLSHVPLFATPRTCHTPGFPEHHQVLELTETHVQ